MSGTPEDRLGQLEGRLDLLTGRMDAYAIYMEQEKAGFKSLVDTELAQHKIVVNELYNSTKVKFAEDENKVQDLHIKIYEAFQKLEERMKGMGSGEPGERRDKEHYYIPTKILVPEAYRGDLSKWKQWKEDIEDYLDTVNKGMKSFLREVEQVPGVVTTDFVNRRTHIYGHKVTGDKVQVWRALKKLTTEEARRVISSVTEEDGFAAWKRLIENFEKGLEARIGVALADLSNMVTKPAKTPNETRILITELENKKKVVEEMQTDKVGDLHFRSLMLGILDPTTRQHTASVHGAKDVFGAEEKDP